MPYWLERMLPFERYALQLDGHRMHVMEVGNGMPVLMLHGNPTWGFLYRKVAAALRGEPLRLIMPDLIGLGFSDKPGSAFHHLETHARIVASLVDSLDLRALLLVCHDWAGPIGGCALARRPERVAGIVVLNTVLGPPKPGFRPTAFHRFANRPVVSDIAFRLFRFPQRALHKAQGDPRSIHGDVARAYRYPLRGLRNNAAPLALARMVPTTMQHESIGPLQSCEAFIKSFKRPAAIVWGDKDPVLGRVKHRIQELLPQASLTSTAAGHFLQEEVPDPIAEAIVSIARQIRSATQTGAQREHR
jgi:haloalkane dehalogenase